MSVVLRLLRLPPYPLHRDCFLKVAKSLASRYPQLILIVSLKTVSLDDRPLTKPDGHPRSRSAGISSVPLFNKSVLSSRLSLVAPAVEEEDPALLTHRFHFPKFLRQLTIGLAF